MTRKYICDNCGKEVPIEADLRTLVWRTFSFAVVGEPIGDYCIECRDRIVKRIKEGVN